MNEADAKPAAEVGTVAEKLAGGAITLEDIDRKISEYQRCLAQLHSGGSLVLTGLIHALVESGTLNKAEIRASVELVTKRLKLSELGGAVASDMLTFMDNGFPERKPASPAR